ncbi:pilus assembly protein TadG-related protein [Agrococcus sp. DT81.2]|uniref:pilus assembly protein TadG-related protein n=1 Tax=Agrococcus sp. DT81.2 TaxID=3393414 RepID=UPI003CE4F279
MQRLNAIRDDRGAVAVWLALLLVPLLVVAALAVDIGALHADRQRLQHGADAAALAIAQQCATGACGDADDMARRLVDANRPAGGPVELGPVDLNEDAGWVEVRTASERDHWFAPAVGNDDAQLAAAAFATWTSPIPTQFPLAYSYCEVADGGSAGSDDPNDDFNDWLVRDASGSVIGMDVPENGASATLFNKGTGVGDTACRVHHNGQVVPGNFGWLDAPCTVPLPLEDGLITGDTGNTPKQCSNAEMKVMLDQQVLIPVFLNAEKVRGERTFTIMGFVLFTVESYYFAGQYVMTDRPNPCGGSNRCLHGTIERYIDIEEAPDFRLEGTAQLRLREEVLK